MKNFDISGFIKMQKDLEKLYKKSPKFIEKTTIELVERLSALAVGNTPTGEKPKLDDSLTEDQKKKAEKIWEGYTGGTLKDGWTIKTPQYFGKVYVCKLINTVSYAWYVEYGHWQQKGKYIPALGKCLSESWSPGKYMLERSMNSLKKVAPKIIERNINELLGGAFTSD